MKILIAEDDMSSRKLLTGLTRNWGYELVVAVDGAAALRLFSADETIRIALLDWMMPGASGVDVCRAIKSSNRKLLVYVIMLTSRSEKGNLIQAFAAGTDDYLTKPFVTAELRARLTVGERVVLGESAQQQKIGELEQELSQFRRLRQFVPKCAQCKSIRADGDYWRPLEEYLRQHAAANYGNEFCPDCRKLQLESFTGNADELPSATHHELA